MIKLWHEGFQHAAYFLWRTVITKKNQNFMVLPLTRNAKPGAGSVQCNSRAKFTAASRDLDYDP